MTSNLLYASLLMSLLAAFIAMLGKQWLNRYLRHTGGSMVERCGDRQRKFNGLERWPFRLFIESLPIILQIALFFLTCGLSRYMWSVNTSVARVVISFTIIGILFYIGIVVAGTSSYSCPFQTPASMTLQYLRDSKTTQKMLASLSLPNVISFIHATWVNTKEGLALVFHCVCDTTYPWSWEISLSSIISGITTTTTRVGYQSISILLWIGLGFWNVKQRLVQRFQRFRHAILLPTTIMDTYHGLNIAQNGPGLQLPVQNLAALRKQNTANAHCVCWVLWNITDSEAIDSAICLAGTIRWFDGDSNHNPPFDFIVSTFESCFDSTRQLYPGMRDRAYFSARAILKIHTSAKSQSHEHASKYPIPAISPRSFQHIDPDLHNILHMLKLNFGPGRPTLEFPRVDTNTYAHLLWMSNLFIDLTHGGPNPILRSCHSYFSATVTNHQAMIANTLLVWYMLLGGHVEEETFWAVDKSYAVTFLSFLQPT